MIKMFEYLKFTTPNFASQRWRRTVVGMVIAWSWAHKPVLTFSLHSI